ARLSLNLRPIIILWNTIFSTAVARKFDLTKPNLTKKLARFADLARFPNTVEVADAYKLENKFELAGIWAEELFKNQNPITLELACGKGEYSVGQGYMYPERNFIGVDIKGNRIWKGAKQALEDGLSNVGFLRASINHLDKLFAEGEVDEIWIIFPDPQLQTNRERNRLTSPNFINRYREILKDGGIVQLKTDNPPFFEYTKEIVAELGLKTLCESTDVYADLEKGENKYLCDREKELRIRTFYEEMWLKEGLKINYIAFQL
ncbi:tRNA (guanosine(46)-N7)-methyltransferase TrmB, partial [Flavobacteriales bacterium]|nr:tRNA (guanosine(46)-N7)-methyltransferase TrmB [Flavobacteriales bacterium]